MDRPTVDDSSARAEEAEETRWDDFAATSPTRHGEVSLCGAEEAMSLLFILSHLSSAGMRMSQFMVFPTKTFLCATILPPHSC
jgi:hypothetical protein